MLLHSILLKSAAQYQDNTTRYTIARFVDEKLKKFFFRKHKTITSDRVAGCVIVYLLGAHT
nr:MAG TPA: hypothetical protein [Caudoviricetes sp.]